MVWVIVVLGVALYVAIAIIIGQGLALARLRDRLAESEQERLHQTRQTGARERELSELEGKAKGGAA